MVTEAPDMIGEAGEMSVQSGRKRTIVDLHGSRASSSFGPGECLWDDEIGRITALIIEHLMAIDDRRAAPSDGRGGGDTLGRGWSPAGTNDRSWSRPTSLDGTLARGPTLSLALYGTYGAGKSSLLATLADWFNEDSLRRSLSGNRRVRKLVDGDTGYLHRIRALPVIGGPDVPPGDPFLYTFLAQALEEDLHHQQRARRGADAQVLSPVQQAFQEASEYLQAVDPSPKVEGVDHLALSLERLDRHSSMMRLKETIAGFIDALAYSLGGSADSILLLPIDDVDMNPELLIDALKTLRTYLQHPRLVPIFTFTGRIAEELLRSQFKRDLRTEPGEGRPNRLVEAATASTIPDRLAMQYLGKLFPVRNRIKLNQAAHRVVESSYWRTATSRAKGEAPKGSVKDLLQSASVLLFGVPEWPLFPEIRMPLQSSTLRRQLQIVDAMHSVRANRFLPESGIDEDASWAETFDRATWSLLNIHRDVLKEFGLDLDDLYSWTPGGLRQVLTKSVMGQPAEKRRHILQRWTYRTQDRRSQILSLLAVNAFRPRMYESEATLQEPANLPREGQDLGFSVRKGALWFLRVWLGFYLPQLLADKSRFSASDEGCGGEESISGVAWDLHNAPMHAMSAALRSGHALSVGMMFLDVDRYKMRLKELVDGSRDDGPWQKLLLPIWCFHGNRRGEDWAAVSMWRGMGLVARLVAADIRFWADIYQEHSNRCRDGLTPTDLSSSERERRKAIVRDELWRHVRNVRVLDPARPDASSEWSKVSQDLIRLPSRAVEDAIESLAKDVVAWLDRSDFRSFRIHPMAGTVDFIRSTETDGEPGRSSRAEDSDFPRREYWKRCFVRRLHGENLLHFFWQDLEAPIWLEDTKSWTARHALQKWVLRLVHYWSCGREVQDLPDGSGPEGAISVMSQNYTLMFLLECPFVKPFAPLGREAFARLRDRLDEEERKEGGRRRVEERKTLGRLQDRAFELQGYVGGFDAADGDGGDEDARAPVSYENVGGHAQRLAGDLEEFFRGLLGGGEDKGERKDEKEREDLDARSLEGAVAMLKVYPDGGCEENHHAGSSALDIPKHSARTLEAKAEARWRTETKTETRTETKTEFEIEFEAGTRTRTKTEIEIETKAKSE